MLEQRATGSFDLISGIYPIYNDSRDLCPPWVIPMYLNV